MRFWMNKTSSTKSRSTQIIFKLIPHVIIIMVFIILCIVVFKPLFLNMNKIQGESTLQHIELPKPSDDLTYYISVLNISEKSINFNGWGFINGQDSINCQKFIVLKSDYVTYIFDTVLYDPFFVREQYQEAGQVLKNTGFTCTLPMRDIKSGEYSVGLYLQEGDNRSLKLTDTVIVKNNHSVYRTIWISKQQNIELTSTTQKSKFWVDGIKEDYSNKCAFVQIDGWGFIEGLSAENNIVYLILKSDTEQLVFSTFSKSTPWVTDQFEDVDLALEKSGFIARIPTDKISKEVYTIGIFIENNGIESFSDSGRVLTKNNGHFSLK